MTPYQRIRGKRYDRPAIEFGECVHALTPGYAHSAIKNKLDSRWFDAIFVGIDLKNHDFLVGTNVGIRRVRTLRRKPEPDRWK